MILRDFYRIIVILFFTSNFVFSQNEISGYIIDENTNMAIPNAKIYSSISGLTAISDDKGFFIFAYEKESVVTFFSENYKIKEFQINEILNKKYIYLSPLIENLDEIEIIARNNKIFSLARLNEFEGTSIYKGKKNEVILVAETMANLASNNSRQIYSQVPGLNIYQNDDAGIQLNIGGRGLDPNRTSNFNTRQNGYDISADVLGYPESYYTPPSESIKNIQIVRGAASLQYGTQFGGLVNFVLDNATKNQDTEINFRNTIGSNNLYTNFTSIKGSKNKFRFYSFINFKQGNGFRKNSFFNSKNFFLRSTYDFNDKSKLSMDITYFTYLSQQAGGLNDAMFNNDPFQSNRARNWFNVDWFLYNLKFEHKFNDSKILSLNLFGLNAVRNALGFRVNRVDQIDSNDVRDLINGDFINFGIESKYLSNYNLFSNKSIFVIGSKVYISRNYSRQGPGSEYSDADFNFYDNEFPNYVNQSDYKYPNQNISIFGETIIKLSDKLSLTPGFRFEFINTKAEGSYERIVQDAAMNVISHDTIYENRKNKRSFVLTGIGLTYNINNNIESYANISQNYRSVTFADISTVNPAYAIDTDITDENGYTLDLGFRGNLNNYVNYDFSLFYLSYNNRIGFVQKLFDDGNTKAFRTNTGDAEIFGIEKVIDINLKKLINLNESYIFNAFFNLSIIESKYKSSNEPGVEGNEVEFVPKYNFKTGLKFGYKNFTSYMQYSYLSDQFSDSTNAINSNLSGVIGIIPSYDILDLSVSYSFKKIRLESGINNMLNSHYFTRRATGYPGPGIIPSPPRNTYITLQYKF